jgi:hypothetical protein
MSIYVLKYVGLLWKCSVLLLSLWINYMLEALLHRGIKTNSSWECDLVGTLASEVRVYYHSDINVITCKPGKEIICDITTREESLTYMALCNV